MKPTLWKSRLTGVWRWECGCGHGGQHEVWGYALARLNLHLLAAHGIGAASGPGRPGFRVVEPPLHVRSDEWVEAHRAYRERTGQGWAE